MLTVTFGEKTYEFSLDETLKSLTGAESMLVEDFLGGWHRFRDPGNMTRSTIVIVWLAKRSAGEQTTFDEIAATPGLLFGDALALRDDDRDEPDDPKKDPGRPLAATNDASESTDGSTGSEPIQAIFDSSGPLPSPESTPA